MAVSRCQVLMNRKVMLGSQEVVSCGDKGLIFMTYFQDQAPQSRMEMGVANEGIKLGERNATQDLPSCSLPQVARQAR